jgi:hypothetical protein
MGKRNAPLPKEKKTEEDVVKGKGVSTRAGARTVISTRMLLY